MSNLGGFVEDEVGVEDVGFGVRCGSYVAENGVELEWSVLLQAIPRATHASRDILLGATLQCHGGISQESETQSVGLNQFPLPFVHLVPCVRRLPFVHLVLGLGGGKILILHPGSCFFLVDSCNFNWFEEDFVGSVGEGVRLLVVCDVETAGSDWRHSHEDTSECR